MINGMQIAVHLTAFNVLMPNNTEEFIETLVNVATFDIPFLNAENLFGKLPNDTVVFLEPEGYENLTKRLDPLGYGSHYISNVMGSIYIYMLATILGLFIIILLSVTRFRKLQQKLENFLLWNWIIRLIIQASLEFSFTVFLNWPFMKRITCTKSFFEFLDYAMTILVTILLITLPIFIVIFYRKYFHKLG